MFLVLSGVQSLKASDTSFTLHDVCTGVDQQSLNTQKEEILENIKYIDINRPSLEDRLQHLAHQMICSSVAIDYDYGIAKGYEFLGYHHYSRTTLDSALLAFNKAREYADESNFLDVMSRTSNGLGLTYTNLNFYDIAMLYQQEYLDYAQRDGHLEHQVEANNNIALLYFYLGNYEKQRSYQAKADQILKQEDYSPENKGWQIRADGLSLVVQGDLEGAMNHFREALKIWQDIKFSRGICRIYIDIGQANATANPDLCLEYLQKAYELNKSYKSKEISVTIDYELGQHYKRLNNIELALKYIKRASSNAVKYRLFSRSKQCALALVGIYREMGDVNSELEVLRANKEWSNAGTYLRNQSLETWIRYQNKLLQKERETARLEQIAAKNLRYFLASVITLGLIILIGAVITMRLSKRNTLVTSKNKDLKNVNEEIANKYKIIQKQKEELEKAKAELEKERNNAKADLTKKMMNMAREKTMVNELAKKIKELELDIKDRNILLNTIEVSQREQIWKDLDLQLSKTHEHFFAQLAANSNKLTNNDFRLAAYIKMHLSTKDIARISNKTVDSVKMAKSRLRKKLNLTDSSIKLACYFNQLGAEAQVESEQV